MSDGEGSWLVAYGVDRGRRRVLRRVVQDLDELLEDDLATEETLRNWRDELKIELDRVTKSVEQRETMEVPPT